MQRNNPLKSAGGSMRLPQSIADGYTRIIPSDRLRAKSLTKAATQALYSAQKLAIETETLKTILRELYEALRQYCEAIGYIQGYKFTSHEVISIFLEEVLKEQKLATRFDRYRKLRNGINYYGDDISEVTIREALKDIPEMIKQLEKYYPR